ncbi:hypothetical protein BBAD15_g5026 [Beauveria bassiana D1-5]|uniref:Uncharacterized protein n=1 Tax=Beauveria bassiana D1-5 TaxID=1245745 RepID=A0A0A2VTH9_BEABA|nr:hypothetical protein BBAD15_g5026 [Beauveria bassiana D1-5]
MSDSEYDGLLNIEVSDAEDTPAEKKAKRTGQSEEAFQAVRKTYVTKVQNGDIYKHIKLPLQSGASNLDIQEVLHAVEELYFFRRYNEAIDFAAQVLQGESRAALDSDSLQVLENDTPTCFVHKYPYLGNKDEMVEVQVKAGGWPQSHHEIDADSKDAKVANAKHAQTRIAVCK